MSVRRPSFRRSARKESGYRCCPDLILFTKQVHLLLCQAGENRGSRRSCTPSPRRGPTVFETVSCARRIQLPEWWAATVPPRALRGKSPLHPCNACDLKRNRGAPPVLPRTRLGHSEECYYYTMGSIKIGPPGRNCTLTAGFEALRAHLLHHGRMVSPVGLTPTTSAFARRRANSCATGIKKWCAMPVLPWPMLFGRQPCELLHQWRDKEMVAGPGYAPDSLRLQRSAFTRLAFQPENWSPHQGNAPPVYRLSAGCSAFELRRKNGPGSRSRTCGDKLMRLA